MNAHVLKPSELKQLLHCNGVENYRFKGFLSGGSFPKLLLENTQNNHEVIGKIVSSPSEGELKHWIKFRHPNIYRLLDIICIDYNVKIFVSPVAGKYINDVIHDSNFIQHPLCFDRKKCYARDILLGLNYMHRNYFYHLNLADSNVAICSFSDKAIICDFRFAVQGRRVTKMVLPTHYLFESPEISYTKDNELLDCLPIDIWACGILLLQIFTQHLLPWHGLLSDSLESLDNTILKKANIGSCLQVNTAIELREFLKKLLFENPKLRLSVDKLLKLKFLQYYQERLDKAARNFWESCDTPKIKKPMNSRNESIEISNGGETLSLNSLESELEDVSAVSESQSHISLDFTSSSESDNTGKAHAVKAKSDPRTEIHIDDAHRNIRMCTSVPIVGKRSASSHSRFSYGENISLNGFQEYETADNVVNQKVDKFEQSIDSFHDESVEEHHSATLSEWQANNLNHEFNIHYPNRMNRLTVTDEFSSIASINKVQTFPVVFPVDHENFSCNSPVDYNTQLNGWRFENNLTQEPFGTRVDLLRRKALCVYPCTNLHNRLSCNIFPSSLPARTECHKMRPSTLPESNQISTSRGKVNKINYSASWVAKSASSRSIMMDGPSPEEMSKESVVSEINQKTTNGRKDKPRKSKKFNVKDIDGKCSLKHTKSSRRDLADDIQIACKRQDSEAVNGFLNKGKRRRKCKNKLFQACCLGCKSNRCSEEEF